MRRFISYIALSCALILGSALATVPMIMNLDGDLAYADGQTLVFRAATHDETSDNGNYGNTESGELTFIDNTRYITKGQKAPIEYIADTMRTRLDKWGVSGYNVETEGDYTVNVSLRAGNNSTTTLSYLERILSFNGGDFALDATDTSFEDYSPNEKWNSLFVGQTARIEDIDMQGYKVPVVVVPLQSGSEYKDAFLDLITYCESHTDKPDDSSSAQQDLKTTNLVLWANRSKNDPEKYTDAYDGQSVKNKNVAAKVVMIQNSNRDNCIWYDSSDKNKETPSLMLIPASKATQSGTYDPTYTAEAYDAARYILTLMNSDAYEYDAFKGGDISNKFDITFLYSRRAEATVENLINKGYNKEPAMSRTLISVIVIVAFLCLILALFERAFALLHIASFVSVGFSSFAMFVAFGAQFNIAALIGLGVAALGALFGSLYYTSRVKDEIYKGRTMKKAHTEAAKRSTWPIIDAGAVMILIGVFTYVLGGDIAAKAGVMLVLGGFLSIVFNLIFTRWLGWMFTNDSYVSAHHAKLLRLDESKIPDLLKEEKQSYFGPYADKNFHKGAKVGSIVLGLFLLAGIGSMIGWGVANNGSFFNSSSYEVAPSSLRIEVKSEAQDRITVEKLSHISSIYDELDKEHVSLLAQYKINDKQISDLVANVTLSQTSHEVVTGTDSDDLAHDYWWYYEITLKDQLKVGENPTFAVWDGTDWVSLNMTRLEDLATEMAASVVGENSDSALITFNDVKPQALTPYFWQVALGLGVGLAVSLVYLVIRYRPSRGLSLSVLTASVGFSAVAFFALTRISTTPVVSLGAIPVIVTMLLASLFILANEKEVWRESREKEKDNLAFRSQCLASATSRQAGLAILFVLLSAYIAIASFSFGPSAYATPYIAAILGIALTTLAMLTVLGPSAILLAKGFDRISFRPSLPRRKKKGGKIKGGQLMAKKKGAEPEEAIFIGIND